MCSLREALRGTVIAVLLLAPAAAHDIEISVQLAAPSVVTRAAYAGRDAVSFAEVAVHKAGSETEYQTGRTDQNGNFAFVPDGSGSWRITVDDELGHRVEKTIDVPQEFASRGETVAAGLTLFQKAFVGLALILGVTGLLYGYKAHGWRKSEARS